MDELSGVGVSFNLGMNELLKVAQITDPCHAEGERG